MTAEHRSKHGKQKRRHAHGNSDPQAAARSEGAMPEDGRAAESAEKAEFFRAAVEKRPHVLQSDGVESGRACEPSEAIDAQRADIAVQTDAVKTDVPEAATETLSAEAAAASPLGSEESEALDGSAEGVKVIEAKPAADPVLDAAPADSGVPTLTDRAAPEEMPLSDERGARETAEKTEKRSGSGVARFFKRLFLLILFCALLAAAGAGWLYWNVFKRPLDFPGTADTVDVMIEEGDSARRVIDKIRGAGIRVADHQVRVLSRLQPEALSRLHIGLYRFKRGITAEGLVETLKGDPLIDQRIRIPDGAPVWEIERILAGGVNLKQDAAALAPEELRKRLGLEDYPSLEGFIAPETYRYGSGSSDLSVLRMAVDRQKRLLAAAWETRSPLASALKSPYELLILASIIEKETGEKSDRHLVSSVFHNRLKRGMPLQTDPTVIYGLGPDWRGRLTKRDLQKETPYNTYKIRALPPTPISSPTPASIEAAANPADTDFLYFVARGDGTSEFTTNLRDHNRAVRHYLIDKKSTPFKPRYAKERRPVVGKSSSGSASARSGVREADQSSERH